MQEMQFASFASSEWKGVVGTLPGIDTQGSYRAATRYSTSSSLSVNRSITSTPESTSKHHLPGFTYIFLEPQASCARYLGTEL